MYQKGEARVKEATEISVNSEGTTEREREVKDMRPHEESRIRSLTGPRGRISQG